jgi:hypothetical protein
MTELIVLKTSIITARRGELREAGFPFLARDAREAAAWALILRGQNGTAIKNKSTPGLLLAPPTPLYCM